jgi:hypothetical protein
MPSKPKADLASLTLSKDDAPAAPAPAPVGQGTKAYSHTLSLRLTAEQYRRLRRYATGQEEQTGQRMTHQAIIEVALGEYLDRRGG